MKKKINKTNKLRQLFKERGRVGLTCYDAVRYTGYHRLSAFVHDEIKRGVPIQSQYEKNNEGRPYKRYWLDPAANDPFYEQRKSADTDQSSSADSIKKSD